MMYDVETPPSFFVMSVCPVALISILYLGEDIKSVSHPKNTAMPLTQKPQICPVRAPVSATDVASNAVKALSLTLVPIQAP
jgi:hypothetical protein